MASSLLRSSAAVLRRSTPRAATLPRVPGQSPMDDSALFSTSVGAGIRRVEPTKVRCKSPQSHDTSIAPVNLEMALDKLEVNMRETRKLVQDLLEHEKRIEHNEQRQKKLACVLVPATIALWIFGPEKKGNPSPEDL